MNAHVQNVMTRPLPNGARFILTVVFLVATVGLAALAIGDWRHGRHLIAVVDGILFAIAAIMSTRAVRPIARARFGDEEDVFEGSRGILWSVVALILLVLFGVLFVFLTSPDAVRGFMEGWRDAGR